MKRSRSAIDLPALEKRCRLDTVNKLLLNLDGNLIESTPDSVHYKTLPNLGNSVWFQELCMYDNLNDLINFEKYTAESYDWNLYPDKIYEITTYVRDCKELEFARGMIPLLRYKPLTNLFENSTSYDSLGNLPTIGYDTYRQVVQLFGNVDPDLAEFTYDFHPVIPPPHYLMSDFIPVRFRMDGSVVNSDFDLRLSESAYKVKFISYPIITI
jgi:hypothetical protein